MAEECILCKILEGELPSTEVYSDDEFYAFRNINPAAPSHVLVIPREHIERISDVTPENAALLGRMFLAAKAAAEKEGIVESGFRYVINCNEHGGQEIFHVHMHVLGGRPMTWPPG
ncbi:MAG TPA: histidine triad nucleotide-binding protein [Candidatus Hydrogenedentes bacterium]|nr:histidine triad nucleotide-binding protein [Candidatus Hydrogenedentota bacterium]